ncbi:FH1/FH2 domain-containing protein 3 [Eufriesea mexicana]|uniref:FH1/FH2 domain-containing protein 3 n=1 Tax=Eufriesea mexicana TaxID=516756 RepID=A0A310SCW4_9HYME|nr:FH1/FH2 domain-containing protein 3 [Eufriesea mexicana]
MNGVMEHGQTVQWLYTLIASRFRLVVKTALKLLLVFVEYVETNSLLLVRAVRSVDTSRGMIPWTNVMKLLKDYDAADTELLIYATTLVNKCLNGIPDQDTYYDQVDCLEEQGIEGIIQRYMSKQGTDLDLLRQFQIYEAVLHHEDGNDRGSPIRQLDDNIRKTLRNRKSLVDSHERRKSRRHSTGTSPLSMSLNARLSPRLNHSLGLSSLNNTLNSSLPDDDDESSSSQSSQGHLGEVQLNGSYKENKVDVGVTPALRRRRERAERQRSFIREQQEATANMRASVVPSDDQERSNNWINNEQMNGFPAGEGPYATNGLRYTNGTSYERNADSPSNKLSRTNSRKDLTPLMNAANKLDSEEKKPWYGKSPDEGVECDEGNHTDEDEDRRVVLQLKREGTVKDLTQKLAAQNLIPSSPVEEKVSRIGDMSGLISKAKEGLAKSKSKADVLKSPTGDSLPKLQEAKKSENELHWEELVKKLKRPLALCDLDFTDLNSDDEVDVLGPVNVTNGVPPPPPPMVPTVGGARAPPPPPLGARLPPPVPQAPPPMFGVNLKSPRSPTATDSSNTPKSPPPAFTKKSKKTVKLFWKEVRDDPIILSRLDKNKMIWDELSPVPVDTQKLEHLFESRAKDLITKKQQEMNKNKEIIVLDHKRSNAINIGMTKLPPPRSIKTAILKMDATIMNREGIEKLLTMLPTEEERSRIQEAQAANPDLPLGSAEQFLLTLASISELPARLKLWAFKLDFENSEKEIADPLMDLKQGMETLRVNKTFRGILSTLLSIGIFLNGNEVKGFQLEYLAKVPEVKDTVHKHSLLHHLCHMVMEKFPDSTDLYSEIGAVTRASKIDFDELAANIGKLESECKASWDHLKLIAKHDGSTMMKVKCLLHWVCTLTWRFMFASMRVEDRGCDQCGIIVRCQETVTENRGKSSKWLRPANYRFLPQGESTQMFPGVQNRGSHKRAAHRGLITIPLSRIASWIQRNRQYRERSVDISIPRVKNYFARYLGASAHGINLRFLGALCRSRMSDFLADCAERIIVLGIVHRRIINRFHKFILWLGIPLHRVQDTKPNEFCRIVSEFALEYRTTRERVIQQLEKKANHRERNKTRGKMITEVGKFRTKEDRADAELRQLLGSDISDVESIHGTLPWRRQRKDGRTSLGPLLRDENTNGNLTDGDDELLESLVKTATKTPATRTTPRERKRTRHADRRTSLGPLLRDENTNGNLTDGDDELLESLVKTATKTPATRTTPRERKRTRHADLRRTLKNGLSEEEKKHIAAYIKGY